MAYEMDFNAACAIRVPIYRKVWKTVFCNPSAAELEQELNALCADDWDIYQIRDGVQTYDSSCGKYLGAIIVAYRLEEAKVKEEDAAHATGTIGVAVKVN